MARIVLEKCLTIFKEGLQCMSVQRLTLVTPNLIVRAGNNQNIQ